MRRTYGPYFAPHAEDIESHLAAVSEKIKLVTETTDIKMLIKVQHRVAVGDKSARRRLSRAAGGLLHLRSMSRESLHCKAA